MPEKSICKLKVTFNLDVFVQKCCYLLMQTFFQAGLHPQILLKSPFFKHSAGSFYTPVKLSMVSALSGIKISKLFFSLPQTES